MVIVHRFFDYYTLTPLSTPPPLVLQYLEFCDEVLLLESGKVKEAGSHSVLMKANGRYAHLLNNYQLEQSEVTALSAVGLAYGLFFICSVKPDVGFFCINFLKEKKEEAPESPSNSSEQSKLGRAGSKSKGILNAGQRTNSSGNIGLI